MTPHATSRASASHYSWGDSCDGWRLVDEPGLSVIEEQMPPGSEETPHTHRMAGQFFRILRGRCLMRTPDGDVALDAGEGVHIPAGRQHQMCNPFAEPLVFLVISAPTTTGDRHPAAGPAGTDHIGSAPGGLPRYRLLTGRDTAEFCHRVSAALALGYVLHGDPAIARSGSDTIAAQALLWPGPQPSRPGTPGGT